MQVCSLVGAGLDEGAATSCLLPQRMTTVHALADIRHAPSLRLLAQELLKTELGEKTYEAETVTSWCVLPKRVQSGASPHDKMLSAGRLLFCRLLARENAGCNRHNGLLEPVDGRVVSLSSRLICCSRPEDRAVWHQLCILLRLAGPWS